MKTKVTIKGDLYILDYCSKSLIDEENDFVSQYYTTGGWIKIESLTVNDGDENLVKKKGKYSINPNLLRDMINPLPAEIHYRNYYEQELEYEIEHEEPFDIKKLQIEKSTYEFDEIPFFICADYVLYDGKKFYNYDIGDYEVESKCYNEFEIE